VRSGSRAATPASALAFCDAVAAALGGGGDAGGAEGPSATATASSWQNGTGATPAAAAPGDLAAVVREEEVDEEVR
jgi:hypothetical protein